MDGFSEVDAPVLESLVSAFPDVGFIIDENGRYLQVLSNPESSSLLYDVPDNLVGNRLRDLFPEDDAAQFLSVVETAVETGSTQTFEYSLDVDGRTRWFEANVCPVRDGADPRRVVWVARDVTERERYRRTIERQRDYMSEMLDSVNDVFYVVDEDGRFVDWNDALGDVTGYADEEIATRNALEFFPEETIAELSEVGRDMRDHRRASVVEAPLVTRDGERIPYEFVGGVFEDPSGETLIVGIGRDISERKRQERRIRAEKEYVDAILDSIDDVFYLLDAEGNMLRWNDSLADVTGYSDDEIAEMHALEFFENDDVDTIRSAIYEGFTEGYVKVRAAFVSKDGERIPYEYVATTFQTPSGEPVLCGIGRDVTEREEREQQVQVFGRVFRHNLRNKMIAINGGAELLRPRIPPELLCDLELIERAAEELIDISEKANEVVNLLLRPSKQQRFEIDEVLENVARRARETHPDATIEIDASSTPVRGISAMPRALEELVENAIVHTPSPAPTVEVWTESNRNTVTVHVADEGYGIPQEEVNVLTHEREITPLYHGEGLGLWLVRWVVIRSHGTIAYRERDPHGSVVSVELIRPENVTLPADE